MLNVVVDKTSQRWERVDACDENVLETKLDERVVQPPRRFEPFHIHLLEEN